MERPRLKHSDPKLARPDTAVAAPINQNVRMRHVITAFLVLALGCASQPKSAVVAFEDGRWYNGHVFVERTMYVVDGTLRMQRPRRITKFVDLHGDYVIPPLAEAHNHWLEPDKIDTYIHNYLADGVFYVMDQANVPIIAEQVRAKTNRPSSVDYRVAILGFTAPGAHPIQIVKQFVKMGEMPATWNSEAAIDRNALLIVSSEKDVDDRWPALQAAKPDFVKVFLEFSEEFERRRNDETFVYRRGIDPKLVPYIVHRAHRDGLRVSAHVYSAADFRNAIAAGVDFVAHMPGTGAGEEPDLNRFLITDADAQRTATQGTPVITTLGWLDELRQDAAARADLVERVVIRPNVEKLRRAGVRLLIGSDQFRKTPVGELFILARLGVSNEDILRMAVSDTARAIFPRRRIGALDDGYEASFLALQGNPLDDLANVRKIALRVKRGVQIP